MTEPVSICGTEKPGGMCLNPAESPGKPCRSCRLAPPGAASRALARKELTGALVGILDGLTKEGVLVIDTGKLEYVAETIFNDLTMHVALRVLSGMAAPPT